LLQYWHLGRTSIPLLISSLAHAFNYIQRLIKI